MNARSDDSLDDIERMLDAASARAGEQDPCVSDAEFLVRALASDPSPVARTEEERAQAARLKPLLSPAHGASSEGEAITPIDPPASLRFHAPQQGSDLPHHRHHQRRSRWGVQFAAAALVALAGAGVWIASLRTGAPGGNAHPFGFATLSVPADQVPAASLPLGDGRFDWDAFAQSEAIGAARAVTLGTPAERNRWRTATVIVQTDGGHGSGVFISEDGLMLTNFHVVQRAWNEANVSGRPAQVEVIRAIVSEQNLVERLPGISVGTVLHVDPSRDLALVRVARQPDAPPFAFVSVLPSGAADVGDACYRIGSPGYDSAWNYETGEITNRYVFPDGLTSAQVDGGSRAQTAVPDRVRATVLRTNMPTSGGDSGGPLLNAAGELIGLTFATTGDLARNSGSVGMHIDVSEIRTFLAGASADAPAPAPLDLVTGGMEGAVLVHQSDDFLRAGTHIPIRSYVLWMPPSRGSGQEGKPVGRLDFVLAPSTGSTPPVPLPAGLWGLSDQSGPPFLVAWMINARGVRAVQINAPDGSIEQRIDTNEDGIADIIYVSPDGKRWTRAEETSATRLATHDAIAPMLARLIEERLRLTGDRGSKESGSLRRKP